MRRWVYVLALLVVPVSAGVAWAKKPVPPAAKPVVKNEFSDALMVPWSLAPPLGATEAKLGMRAEREDSDPAPGSEQIFVFGKRRAPVGSVDTRHEDAGAESWQSEAAQSYVPGIGEGCSYKNGCFDKGQEGLFTSVPALFGDH